eukprot:GHVR01050815.1.p1 GENE.GHVR01050815.1~~GHVR01050815.1.p1  ORF type:complete len:240 (+),score=32.53 GHVR01050815.1:80-799(+)
MLQFVLLFCWCTVVTSQPPPQEEPQFHPWHISLSTYPSMKDFTFSSLAGEDFIRTHFSESDLEVLCGEEALAFIKSSSFQLIDHGKVEQESGDRQKWESGEWEGSNRRLFEFGDLKLGRLRGVLNQEPHAFVSSPGDGVLVVEALKSAVCLVVPRQPRWVLGDPNTSCEGVCSTIEWQCTQNSKKKRREIDTVDKMSVALRLAGATLSCNFLGEEEEGGPSMSASDPDGLCYLANSIQS